MELISCAWTCIWAAPAPICVAEASFFFAWLGSQPQLCSSSSKVCAVLRIGAVASLSDSSRSGTDACSCCSPHRCCTMLGSQLRVPGPFFYLASSMKVLLLFYLPLRKPAAGTKRCARGGAVLLFFVSPTEELPYILENTFVRLLIAFGRAWILLDLGCLSSRAFSSLVLHHIGETYRPSWAALSSVGLTSVVQRISLSFTFSDAQYQTTA